VRRLVEDPTALFASLVEPGMTLLDFGCAMGFHSLPAARLVGEQGRVICVDVQPRMLAGLRRRAARAGLEARIDPRLCGADDCGLHAETGTVDLALAIHVLHETPDPGRVLVQLQAALRPGGRLVLAEPGSHVPAADFTRTVACAQAAGFRVERALAYRRGRAVLLRKPR
jgi:SAM-dependent methyltransferase